MAEENKTEEQVTTPQPKKKAAKEKSTKTDEATNTKPDNYITCPKCGGTMFTKAYTIKAVRGESTISRTSSGYGVSAERENAGTDVCINCSTVITSSVLKRLLHQHLEK